MIGVSYIHKYAGDLNDMVNYYNVLDLYSITSRCEGGPAALLESWACGITIVSTRVGMPADLIRHDGNGMMGEVEDVESLCLYAMELIENADLRKC